MITYYRNSEHFPNCKTCQKPMNYWVVGLPDTEHEHPECFGKRIANELLQKYNQIDILL